VPLFPSLLLDEMAQLPLHRLEGVMNYLAERVVRSVILLFLLRDELVTRRHRYVDTNPKEISLLMGVVRLFDRDITTIDVVAKFLQTRRFPEDDLLDRIGFFDAAIGDVDGQLHDSAMTH
jgi:hypothetical protein